MAKIDILISTVANGTQQTSRELQGLSQRLDVMNRSLATNQRNWQQANRHLTTAAKGFTAASQGARTLNATLGNLSQSLAKIKGLGGFLTAVFGRISPENLINKLAASGKAFFQMAQYAADGAKSVERLRIAYDTAFKGISQRYISLQDAAESFVNFQRQSFQNMGSTSIKFMEGYSRVLSDLTRIMGNEAKGAMEQLTGAFAGNQKTLEKLLDQYRTQGPAALRRFAELMPTDQARQLAQTIEMLESKRQDPLGGTYKSFQSVVAKLQAGFESFFLQIATKLGPRIESMFGSAEQAADKFLVWFDARMPVILEAMQTAWDKVSNALKAAWNFVKPVVDVMANVNEGTLKWITYIWMANAALKALTGQGIAGVAMGVGRATGAFSSFASGARSLAGATGGIGGSVAAIGGIGAIAAGSYYAGSMGQSAGRALGGYIGGGEGTKKGLGIGGGALAGAGVGALIGSVVPVIGTGVGALIGGAIGGVTAAFESFSAEEKEAQDKILAQQQKYAEELERKNQQLNEAFVGFANSKGMLEAQHDLGQAFASRYGAAYQANLAKYGDEETARKGAAYDIQNDIYNSLADRAVKANPQLAGMSRGDLIKKLQASNAGHEVMRTAAAEYAKASTPKPEDSHLYPLQQVLEQIRKTSEAAGNLSQAIDSIAQRMEMQGPTAANMARFTEKRAMLTKQLDQLEGRLSEAYRIQQQLLARGMQDTDDFRMVTQQITELEEKQTEAIQRRKQLREAEHASIERQIGLVEKYGEGLKLNLQASEALFGSPALAAANLRANMQNLQTVKEMVSAQLELATLQRQEEELRGGDVVGAMEKEIDLQNKLKSLTVEQLQAVKSVRDGYLDAIDAQSFGLGTFSKLIVSREKNVGLGQLTGLNRKNMLTGMLGNAQDRTEGFRPGVTSMFSDAAGQAVAYTRVVAQNRQIARRAGSDLQWTFALQERLGRELNWTDSGFGKQIDQAAAASAGFRVGAQNQAIIMSGAGVPGTPNHTGGTVARGFTTIGGVVANVPMPRGPAGGMVSRPAVAGEWGGGSSNDVRAIGRQIIDGISKLVNLMSNSSHNSNTAPLSAGGSVR